MKKVLLVALVVFSLKLHAQKKQSFQYIKGKPVPYAALTKAPKIVNDDCKKKSKKCFENYVSEFFASNLNKSVTDNLNLKSKVVRIYSMIETNDKGEIVNIKVRAPHEKIEEETRRVWKLLPKMTPAEYKSDKVGMYFTLPILYKAKR